MRALFALILLGCSPDPYPGETGDVLHVALRALPKSFDPIEIEDESSAKIAANVYEGLLQMHPFARPYQVMPALAAEMPTVSEDGRTWTFPLKRGVRFHDDPCFPGGEGRELVAEDVVWALKRFAHPTSRSKGWWLFDGRIAGLDAWRVARRGETADGYGLSGMDVPVEGLLAVDTHTVQFRLTAPYPQFLWTLAMGYTAVYPREAVAFHGAGFRNHPVGTGPFRVTAFDPVYRMVAERNPTFREERVPDPRRRPEQRWAGWEQDEADGYLVDAGARIPLLDGMEIRFILEDQPRWLYFRSGYSDFLNPPKDNVQEALPGGEVGAELTARGVTMQRWTELGTVYTAMNTEDPLLSNVGVRRAIALAHDHAWTVEHLYGGQAIFASSPIPPGVAGFVPNQNPYYAADGRAQVERAKEELARAGFPGGIDPATGRRLHLTLENSGSSQTDRQFGDRFVDEMRRIGVEVDVVVNTFPQLVDKMRKKSFQITSLAWTFDYPDAQNVLQLLYGPNGAPGVNSANFRDPAFDALYVQASTLPDGAERTALYAQMTAIVADQVPWVTRTHRIRSNLQHSWLRGYKYTEVSDQYWRYVGLDDAARDRALAEWNRPTRWPIAAFVALIFAFVGLGVRR